MNDLMKLLETEPWRHAIMVLIIIAGAILLAKVLRAILNRYMKRSSEDLNITDPTTFFFLRNAINFLVTILALILIFYSIPQFKSLGVSLFAGAGIFAAIVGFASQQAFSNLVGGVFIVLFKPFKVGDVIKVGDKFFGIVEDITLRHTVLNSMENRRIVIPNAIVSAETILNSSLVETKICNFVEIGISYDSDIDLAMRLMKDEAMKHPDYIDNRDQEDIDSGQDAVITRVIGFGDSSVNLRAQVWSNDHIAGFSMKCDLNKAIKERFDQEGVEIPYPYRTIVYKEQPS